MRKHQLKDQTLRDALANTQSSAVVQMASPRRRVINSRDAQRFRVTHKSPVVCPKILETARTMLSNISLIPITELAPGFITTAVEATTIDSTIKQVARKRVKNRREGQCVRCQRSADHVPDITEHFIMTTSPTLADSLCMVDVWATITNSKRKRSVAIYASLIGLQVSDEI